jgi:hypothetical protein
MARRTEKYAHVRQAYLVLTLHISLTVLVLLELLHDPCVASARARALLLSDSVAIDGARGGGGAGRLLDPAISFRRDEVTTKGFLDELERFRSDSGFLHKVFAGRAVEGAELHELATGCSPMLEKIRTPNRTGGEARRRSLMSCGAIPLAK